MTEPEDSAGLIDDEGKLLGLVNVVDLLVVLLVLAVGVAGVALVQSSGGNSGASEPAPTRYATLSYSAPLSSDAALLDTDDTVAPPGADTTFTVVDVYRSFTSDGQAHVLTRVAYTGTPSGTDGRLYGGDDTSLSTGSYRVAAHALAVNQTATDIPTTRVSVVLSANVTDATARALEPGQEATIGDEPVATIETVTERSRTEHRRQLLVGVELVAWDTEPVPQFDGEALRVDNDVTIVTETTTLHGQVYTVGTTDASVGT
jgi:hypothetical protein